MKHLRLIVELLEDLHIGTGTGVGDIDSLQVRDRHDRPVLPASHLKGVLRETAREAHRRRPQEISREILEGLFGRSGAGRGHLTLTSAYWEDACVPHSLIWGSTRIDEYGTAHEKSLRFVEYVPAGSRFSLAAELPERYLSEFRRLLTHTPYLGAQRNRGHGRVRWRIEESTPQATILPGGIPQRYPARLRLWFQNLDPLCLPRTAHPGNLITTSGFVRGRALRGGVVGLCLDSGREETAAALLSPTLAWGDARPLPASASATDWEDCAVVPIPLSMGTPKGKAPQGEELPWWANEATNEMLLGAAGEVEGVRKKLSEENERSTEKLKRPKGEEWLFRARSDTPWLRYRPVRFERLHTRPPRPEEGLPEQALFSTEEVVEGTHFVADLVVSSESEACALQDALALLSQRWLRLGRGGRPVTLLGTAWPEPTGPAPAAGNPFFLFLESDLILRNRYGNFATRLDAGLLAEAVGLPGAQVQTLVTFSDSVPVYGFNALTGLPRSAQQAILAGSVIAIAGQDAPLLYEKLCTRWALGESPEEGFGRFRLEIPQPVSGISAPGSFAIPASSRKEELCKEAHGWAKNLIRSGKKLPSRSQWGDLRARALAARDQRDLEDLFARLQEAAQKLGGKSWLALAEDKDWQGLRDGLATERLPFADVKTKIDHLVRWIRVLDLPQGGMP